MAHSWASGLEATVEQLRILIVDDEAPVREGMRMVMEYAGMTVDEASSGEQGLERINKSHFDVVLLDLRLPRMDGLEMMERLSAEDNRPEVIMVSAHADLSTAVQATRLGAFDFLEKPLDQDRLLVTVRNAGRQRRLAREARLLRTGQPGLNSILGVSPATVSLRATIVLVASTDSRALITGESGTGKELVARAIHAGGTRRDEPFVEVNCAALPAELIESELFGHEKGAFTGATARRQGKFELAHKGTLFLDEVGDMSMTAQAKVLRVLEEGTLSRVGGNAAISVDVRVIAATNKPLGDEVAQGRFREDLYYRLNVVPIRVPPLRERREDIPVLAAHFLEAFSMKMGKPPIRLGDTARGLLMAHPWPGNVRELKNVMERVALFCTQAEISPQQLSRHIDQGLSASSDALPYGETFEQFVQSAERDYLARRLEQAGWNVTKAAQDIGMQRSNLYKKIERHGLRRPRA
ncbi:sigma-54-dependent Fis family transcriptional regulator [Candidatus Fermentibacteria bacterium]|nr:sigma-54-dependent Fis family transcriptional regulator [Candidatus Fermentibacteria bacterium]